MYPCSRANFTKLTAGVNSNPIFDNSTLIGIPPYSYPASDEDIPIFGNLIELNGDVSIDGVSNSSGCCGKLSAIDKFPMRPTLEWDNIQSNLMAAAIFKNKIEISLDGHRIENVNDIVWTWNSGMNTGSQSSGKIVVEYLDGKDVTNGETQESNTPLEANKTYIWGVWAWNEAGTEIAFSSKAIPFIVESLESLPVISFEQLDGNWQLESATRQSDGVDLTQSFPIQNIDINVTCERSLGELELSYSTFPDNNNGVIISGMNEETIEIEGIIFSNMIMVCDDRFIGNATLNNEQIRISYR
jgi:hypothetical protein